MARLTRRSFLTGAGALVGMGGAASIVWLAPRDLDRAAITTTTGAPRSSSTTTDPTTTTTLPTSSSTAVAPVLPGAHDRVLVVVQLGGGNDGLNTLVPTDGRYHDLRPTLAVADDGLVALPGTEAYGLNPAMAPLLPLLAAGQVAALAGIGYPHPTRSHFAALDDWWSGTPGAASTTGWLGRWLDHGGATDPLTAVALGSGAPALVGSHVRPTVVLSPAAFRARGPKGSKLPLTAVGPAIADTGAAARYRAAVADAGSAVDTFATLSSAGDDAELGGEGSDGEITSGLATAAHLIAREPTTRIVQVAVGGFDTHAGQRVEQDRLLGDLAAGIASFFAALAEGGHDQRVLLVTVSEFGRRAAENGSGGTDHGKAGVQFAVGPGVRGGLYGGLDLAHLDDGDVAAQIDVRSLYTDALTWLGGPVDGVLDRAYDDLSLLRR